MLEKLLGVRSFDGFIGHLVCCQTTFLAFSNNFSLLSIVWTIAPAFLGFWALIVPTFVIHFHYDDHSILLDVVAHVENDTTIPDGVTKYMNHVTLGCPLSSPTF